MQIVWFVQLQYDTNVKSQNKFVVLWLTDIDNVQHYVLLLTKQKSVQLTWRGCRRCVRSPHRVHAIGRHSPRVQNLVVRLRLCIIVPIAPVELRGSGRGSGRSSASRRCDGRRRRRQKLWRYVVSELAVSTTRISQRTQIVTGFQSSLDWLRH